MDTNKMREQFEAWAVKDAQGVRRKLNFEREGDWYIGPDAERMNLAWWSWQASREAVVVELPSEDTCRTSTSKEEAVQEAYNHALGECRAAIEAQGLKVAP